MDKLKLANNFLDRLIKEESKYDGLTKGLLKNKNANEPLFKPKEKPKQVSNEKPSLWSKIFKK